MTVHTIPADHLDAARSGVLVVEAAHDWDLTRFFAPEWALALLEPCETCGGSGHATFGNQVRTSEKCPACDGSGRPWLRVDVLEYGGMSDDGPGPWKADSFRAHVLDVVPIVDEDTGEPCVHIDPNSGEAWYWDNRPPLEPRYIALPPGEHVGRYAVLIEQES